MKTNNDTRLMDLETQVAFLQDALDTLSDEFYAQQKTIDLLVLKINALQDKVDTIDNKKESAEVLDERPPHY